MPEIEALTENQQKLYDALTNLKKEYQTHDNCADCNKNCGLSRIAMKSLRVEALFMAIQREMVPDHF